MEKEQSEKRWYDVTSEEGCDIGRCRNRRGYGRGVEIWDKVERRRRRNFVVVYIPPNTNAWNREDHERMLRDKCLKKIIKGSENRIMMGNFNCKEV